MYGIADQCVCELRLTPVGTWDEVTFHNKRVGVHDM
jgi:hypothetical protein